MHINEYQVRARQTAVYHGKGGLQGVIYNTMKLSGETGEISDKIGKLVGADKKPDAKQTEDIMKEAGDVLWHLSMLVKDLGYTLEEVALANLDKLASRQERGVLVGEGDNR